MKIKHKKINNKSASVSRSRKKKILEIMEIDDQG